MTQQGQQRSHVRPSRRRGKRSPHRRWYVRWLIFRFSNQAALRRQLPPPSCAAGAAGAAGAAANRHAKRMVRHLLPALSGGGPLRPPQSHHATLCTRPIAIVPGSVRSLSGAPNYSSTVVAAAAAAGRPAHAIPLTHHISSPSLLSSHLSVFSPSAAEGNAIPVGTMVPWYSSTMVRTRHNNAPTTKRRELPG